MNSRLLSVAIAVLGPMILFGIAYFVVPPVSARQLRALPNGCGTNQVVAMLGKPTRVLQMDGNELWEYSRWRSYRRLELIVSPDGRCSSFHFEP